MGRFFPIACFKLASEQHDKRRILKNRTIIPKIVRNVGDLGTRLSKDPGNEPPS